MFTKLIRFHSHLLHQVHDQLLAPSCVICGLSTQNSLNICHPCQQDLPILPHSCPRCAQFLPSASITNSPCGACLKNPPPFHVTYAGYPYEHPIIQLIIKLKFQHQLSNAQALGQLLTHAIRTHWYSHNPLPDLIIPIPLHAQRLRERGFNQALEIAKPIAKTLDLIIDYQSVNRIKPTVAQSGLPAAERKRNIAHAFVVTGDYTNKHIAVIDDVITTGHTMLEFCRLLKQSGAARIDVWCCAKRI